MNARRALTGWLAVVVIAAVAALLPHPLRGAVEIILALGAPTWALATLLRPRMSMDVEIVVGLAAIVTLAEWCLGTFGLLAAAVPLSTFETVTMLAVFSAWPLALSTWSSSRARSDERV